MASKGAGAGSTGLWNLHAGWLKVSLIKNGFDGYKKELLASPSSPGKRWKDRWTVINSNKVCLYMDERCIQETAVFALGPEAVIRVWETVEAADEVRPVIFVCVHRTGACAVCHFASIAHGFRHIVEFVLSVPLTTVRFYGVSCRSFYPQFVRYMTTHDRCFRLEKKRAAESGKPSRSPASTSANV